MKYFHSVNGNYCFGNNPSPQNQKTQVFLREDTALCCSEQNNTQNNKSRVTIYKSLLGYQNIQKYKAWNKELEYLVLNINRVSIWYLNITL